MKPWEQQEVSLAFSADVILALPHFLGLPLRMYNNDIVEALAVLSRKAALEAAKPDSAEPADGSSGSGSRA